MAKKIVCFIKLQVPACKANPSPPIGPALGQRGLNIMEFCKAFNAQTQGMEPGLPLPVVITAFADKSFTFIITTPPATTLIEEPIRLVLCLGGFHVAAEQDATVTLSHTLPMTRTDLHWLVEGQRGRPGWGSRRVLTVRAGRLRPRHLRRPARYGTPGARPGIPHAPA